MLAFCRFRPRQGSQRFATLNPALVDSAKRPCVWTTWGAGDDLQMARRDNAALLEPRAGAKQGRMRTHRTSISVAAFLTALAAATPTGAFAGSLLSGYGGPGQGSQVILGSQLLKGPRGGGGGSAGGTSTRGSSPSNASVATPPVEAGGASNSPSALGGSGRSGRSSRAAGGAPRAGRTGGVQGASSAAVDAYPASERSGVPPTSGLLGLSGSDLLYIFLALCILAFTGIFTRRLTGTATGRGRG